MLQQQKAALNLHTCEEEALLGGRQALFVVELLLEFQDGVGGRGVDRDGLARHTLDEDLHLVSAGRRFECC